jgi:hypothetical protein
MIARLVSVGSEEIDAGIVSEAMEMLQDVQVTLDLVSSSIHFELEMNLTP